MNLGQSNTKQVHAKGPVPRKLRPAATCSFIKQHPREARIHTFQVVLPDHKRRPEWTVFYYDLLFSVC